MESTALVRRTPLRLLLLVPALLLTACAAQPLAAPAVPAPAAEDAAPDAAERWDRSGAWSTPSPAQPDPADLAPARASGVVDARTIAVAGGGSVRLLGLAEPGACWSRAAADFLGSLVAQKDLALDGASVRLPGGTDLSAQLVSQGMARAEPDAASTLTRAEAAARKAGLGLWGAPCGGSDSVVTTPAPTTRALARCTANTSTTPAGLPGSPVLDHDTDGVACA
ncbi:thermonuclease family protein [Actinosynnema pretiosum subsp. pretiosum]|uniref:Nuclease (SNase domain protein) n=2 Tax=Actinosynnema TaxID=40566 RepID=C6WGF6_ACTMD|nr:thermonuclease family protein [Actinosynnema mirum]ACU34272.1 nuclease (SNase domain protein) [Actinosynnema mirum DSM 43827]AXX27648.1 Excalibur domain protein [Actinosynnema pretiosum subsp. pretiosum]QUF01652.1 thermonuclease family protein [Actinosynnema pretiosum subsp. pretiosum]